MLNNDKSEETEESIVSDIHSYSVFANIDNRQGDIYGYQMILNKEQMSLIEDIILTDKVKVVDEPLYSLDESSKD